MRSLEDGAVVKISFTLNGQLTDVNTDPARPLLDVLRDDLGLTGTKQGCDHEGECGACTVLLDGQAVRSCLTPVGKVAGRRMMTVEGLGGPDALHPLQAAFIECGAVQCGYCTPGMLMAAKALLDREPDPSREQIVEALAGNLCRCTGYKRIVEAVELAAARMRGEAGPIGPEGGPEPGGRPVIGGDAIRVDSIYKVTGRTRFVEDIRMPGTLHARVVRSPHHHARLLALDTERARRLEGVMAVVTAADIPGENGLGDYSRDEPVLTPVGETVKMKGAPVALVVASSPERAQAGAEAVEAVYEPLPHVFDVEEALTEDALPIYPGGNVLTSEAEAHGDLEEALEASDVVLEATYRTAWQEHAALEREALLGYYDEAGRLTVVGGTHEPHWQQGYVAAALALDPEAVRVIMPPTGGSFGGKQDPWPFIAAALATRAVQRPVLLAYSRSEAFDASPKRHPYRVRYRVGATADGQLTGIRVRVDVNTGGYDGHGQYIANYALTASGGPYRYRAVDAYAQSVYTNGPKAGQFRGFGSPQSMFALECTLDEMAQRLEEDPLEFRLKNAIHQSSISFLGYPVAESLGYQEVLEAVRPRYRAFLEEAVAFNAGPAADGLRKGVGFSGMWYRFGKSGSLRVEAHAELGEDGQFIVYCSAPDYGQGSNTTMEQIAAETLGVPREEVEVVNADTARTPDSGIQGASRATYFVGGAVSKATRTLRREILGTAAEMLDCPPANLILADGGVICPRDAASRSGADSAVSLAEVAREFDRIGKSRKVPGIFDLSPLFPEETRPEYVPLFVTGAQVANVVVNTRTGEVEVPRIAAAHDVGRAINPIDARGQIEGAVVMGLGTALMEEYIPGATTGFGDYYLPTAMSMPEIEVLLVEVPSFEGPFGAKGLGEAAILPSAPAIINGISRAIRARIRTLPATPERVLARLGEGD
jgi:CO/xanthine dehydrogenase Mo-binding subunit/aerobic-type carbon monoxide dehydrogenase small subunit (CoxS/CutS family)